MNAALFVHHGGAYWDLPEVDPWDKTRDARLYSGPCDVTWVRSIVQQCGAVGVACFVKQLGAYAILDPRYDRSLSGWSRRLRDPKGGDPDEWPEDLRVRQFPEVAR